ncbi:MAG TPA: energy transducer TonB [Candidatus Acidoferrales bacterium]|nr:energy transducer TonB [Candidatus Acidoferrales bacterium]
MIAAVMLAIVLQTTSAQTPQPPVTANLCDVVASPDRYSGRMLSVEGILLPGEHSLMLYSTSCKPKGGFDVGIQAVLPPEWVSSANGKQLHELFNRRTNASVKLIGTFESGTGPYGPDKDPFLFTIREISSVELAPSLASALQILTPTEGVNFSPFMIHLYVTVKNNWFAKMPEEAKTGSKGKVTVRFRILEDGTLAEQSLSVDVSSGTKALDDAVVSAIRTSAPFEHLPEAFKGPNIELRLSFFYNLPPSPL